MFLLLSIPSNLLEKKTNILNEQSDNRKGGKREREMYCEYYPKGVLNDESSSHYRLAAASLHEFQNERLNISPKSEALKLFRLNLNCAALYKPTTTATSSLESL